MSEYKQVALFITSVLAWILISVPTSMNQTLRLDPVYPAPMTSTIPELKPKGDKVKVMVIDTGTGFHQFLTKWVDYSKQAKKDFDVHDPGHGTHVTGIIAYGDMSIKENRHNPICDEVEIVSCNIYTEDDFETFAFMPNEIAEKEARLLSRTIQCLEKATRENFDIVNYSLDGSNSTRAEYNAWKKYVATGGIAVVAAGNKKANLEQKNRFPASFGVRNNKLVVPSLPNFYTVMNKNKDGSLHFESDYYQGGIVEEGEEILSTIPGGEGKFLYPITGTSQAAPMFVHRVLKKYCKENLNRDFISKLLKK